MEEDNIKGRNDFLTAPTSTPAPLKVTREIGFVVIVCMVLICGTVTRVLDKTPSETYSILLAGTLIMAASLSGGAAMKIIETFLSRRL